MKSCETERLWLLYHGFKTFLCGNRIGHVLFESAKNILSKNNNTWCYKLVDFYVPRTIQPGDYSMGSGIDGLWHERAVCAARSTGTGMATAGTSTRTLFRTLTGGMMAMSSFLETIVFLPRILTGEFCFQVLFSSHQAFVRFPAIFRTE